MPTGDAPLRAPRGAKKPEMIAMLRHSTDAPIFLSDVADGTLQPHAADAITLRRAADIHAAAPAGARLLSQNGRRPFTPGAFAARMPRPTRHAFPFHYAISRLTPCERLDNSFSYIPL